MSRLRAANMGGTVEAIPSYMALAILGIVFCLPLSLVAMLQAGRVNSLRERGDLNAARKASASAKTWAVASLGVGIIVYLIAIIVTLVAVSVSAGLK